MAGKGHVSVRFKKTSLEGRMSAGEWEEFKRLADYFHLSDDALVAAALKFRRGAHKTIDPPQPKEKDRKTFDELCERYPALQCLFSSLYGGFLDKKVLLSRGKNCFSMPAGIEVRYYPPHLISFEVSYQARLTLDLTQPFSVRDDGSKIIIEV